MTLEELQYRLPKLHTRKKLFPEQKESEEALLVIEKHWIVDLFVYAWIILSLAIPYAGYYAVQYFFPAIGESDWSKVVLMVLAVYSLFVLLIGYIKWLDQNLDLVIITTERVVDVNQTRLFNRRTAQAELIQIQDADGAVRGILGTLLKYGTLQMQTAGKTMLFEMDYVPNPAKMVDWILDIRKWDLEKEELARASL